MQLYASCPPSIGSVSPWQLDPPAVASTLRHRLWAAVCHGWLDRAHPCLTGAGDGRLSKRDTSHGVMVMTLA